MKVRTRMIEEAESAPFCEIAPTEQAIEGLCQTLKRAGGIYYCGDMKPLFGWQFVHDADLGAHVELIFGKDGTE